MNNQIEKLKRVRHGTLVKVHCDAMQNLTEMKKNAGPDGVSDDLMLTQAFYMGMMAGLVMEKGKDEKLAYNLSK